LSYRRPLAQQLKGIKGLKRAYLVRKVDPEFPLIPLYVLGVTTGFFQLHSKSRATRIVKQISEKLQLPGEAMILGVDANLYEFERKMRRVKCSRPV
jgi:hypothetical protein